jgi:hypothetical protein
MKPFRLSTWLYAGLLFLLAACQPITRPPEKPAATAAAQKPVVAETTFSSKTFKLPMSVSFGPDWHVLDDYPDLVTVEKKQEGWQLGFNIVTHAKLADPDDGHLVPFPDDFMSWIKSDPSLVVGEPTEVMVGGMKGTQIDIKSTRTTTKDFLYLPSGITWNIMRDPFGRFILLNDVNGERMFIWLVLTVDAGEYKDALGQAQTIIDSVVFTK